MVEVYDPFATNEYNQYTEAVTVTVGQYNLILPPRFPFYSKDLVLKRNGVALVQGVDFVLVYPFDKLVQYTAMPVYTAVWLLKEYTGSFELTYRAVGKYSTDREDYLTYLKDTPITVPIPRYDDYLGDVFISDVPVQFSRDEWCGETELLNVLKAFGDHYSTPQDSLAEVNNVLSVLLDGYTKIVTFADLASHVNRKDNPHGEKYYDIGALGNTEPAAAALTLNGDTLAALAVKIKVIAQSNFSLTGTKLRSGTTFNQPLTMTDTSRVGASGGLQIDTLGGIKSSNPIRHGLGNEILKLTTPDTVLTIDTSKPNDESLVVNGQSVITAGNITKHLALPDAVNLKYVFANTATIIVTGKGSVDEPLDISLVYKDASLTVVGLGRVTNEFGLSTTLAATPYLLSKAVETLPSKLKRDSSINGVAFSGTGMTLDKSHLGLDKVEDITDVDLPVSTAQQVELDKYSVIGHDHTPAHYGYGIATGSALGVSTVTDLDGAGVLAASTYPEFVSVFDDVSSSTDGSPIKESWKLKRYGAVNRNKPDGVYTSGTDIVFGKAVPFLYDGAVQTIAPAMLSTVGYSGTIYVYVQVTTLPEYVIFDTLQEAAKSLTYIGWFKVNTTGISDYQIQNVTYNPNSDSFNRHMYDAAPHAYTMPELTRPDLPPATSLSSARGYLTATLGNSDISVSGKYPLFSGKVSENTSKTDIALINVQPSSSGDREHSTVGGWLVSAYTGEYVCINGVTISTDSETVYIDGDAQIIASGFALEYATAAYIETIGETSLTYTFIYESDKLSSSDIQYQDAGYSAQLTYNENGRVSKYNSDILGNVEECVYEYIDNVLVKITSTVDGVIAVTTYEYDEHGQCSVAVVTTGEEIVTTTYGYINDILITATVVTSSTTTLLEYKYDDEGRLIKYTDTLANLPAVVTLTYTDQHVSESTAVTNTANTVTEYAYADTGLTGLVNVHVP